MKMIERIYIPTIRRADKQTTFENLPEGLQERVIMVVEPGERHLYNYPCDYLELPLDYVRNWCQLSLTRKFIHKHAGAIKYAVIDDDLTIKRRNSKYWTGKSNMETSRRDATHLEIWSAFHTFGKWLDEEDIGIVGLSTGEAPPADEEYVDTKGVFGMIFVDGRMLSKEIDDMDITSIRIAEDVLFIFECLSRGINTRQSTEWMYSNGSLKKDMQESRVVWTDMHKEQPKDHFQTDEHYQALEYIHKKFPDGIKIYEKDGKRKNTKYWKKVYVPSQKTSLESFFNAK
jgi:hypothetical protein|tara:strand:+ start:1172 stop:2032 length:861 start_codon:yes stop_codon:yes gene_type:complete